ncbi:MAG: 7-carboxy-7-deazaguanine synthase QueE [Gammaproteobacteria bacterium]|nr:7-carboxy-7-deazaguanine synthase QueE [Gammaproteobacteria bacterium]NIR97823.1 7-carboxy-7-deazaguanine synthase QueE [Gammaproteobacteria bacterium]NIT63523.1 7-carboxy-7-deazaguanine synthase QueE [Gammaproteobacteria bacterium]NIV20470.1 7-carboxy-7-deazaguanine synthase QueE [Gammaproteobacteria bacterium]NIX11052.1 7-carboxy-7-deazaguanine synthase QueE [Gammaproteobacteria bacterium]
MERETGATGPERLRVTEIFHSIQGESRTVGWPTVFVRLTGCPLRCIYCDTEYAFQGGHWMALEAVLEAVGRHRARYVTVTGGEPLAQPACLDLLSRLCDGGYEVLLETSGALDVSAVDGRVVKVMDLKTPGSGEVDKNRYENLKRLTPLDQVKFVLCDRADYAWARGMVYEYRLHERCEVLFSPVYGELDARALAEWILEDHLPVRFQIQLHKQLWGEAPGH